MNKKENLNDFVKIFNKLDPKYIKEQNQLQDKKDLEDFKLFKNNLKNNRCYYCRNAINSFEETAICFHWLLQPKIIKKKYLLKVLNKYSLIQFRAYLRWVATAEAFMENINDLIEEQSKEMIIHETIKYQNFNWTISFSKSDFKGHRNADYPHYHLQLMVGSKVRFKFSDHHIKLKKNDIFEFSLMLDHPEIMTFSPIVGASVQNAMNELPPELMLKAMKQAKEKSKGQFRVQTLLSAHNGKTISGDKIAEIIKIANDKNIPIAQAIKESDIDANVKIYLNPSENLPNNLHRNNPRRKKK